MLLELEAVRPVVFVLRVQVETGYMYMYKDNCTLLTQACESAKHVGVKSGVWKDR